MAAEKFAPVGASVLPTFQHLLWPRNWPRAAATGVGR